MSAPIPSSDPHEDGEFIARCGAFRDGTATPEELARLQDELRESPARRRFYLRFMMLHGLLERYGSGLPADAPEWRPRSGWFSLNAWRAIAGAAAAASVVLVAWMSVQVERPAPTVVLTDPERTAPAPQAGPITGEASAARIAPAAQAGAIVDEASPGALLLRNGKSRALSSRTKLVAGDIIITPGQSGAVVRYAGEETVVGVFSGSRAVFDRIDSAKHIRLVHGGLVCDVARQERDQPLTLRTPHAEAVVLGTQFVLSADEKRSHVRVNEGSVRFTDLASNQTVEALAGDESEAGEGVQLALLRRAGSEPPRVTGFTLVSADDGQPVPGFDPLLDGAVIRLGALASPRLSIRANTAPFSVGTVKFRIAGTGTNGEPLGFRNHENHNFASHAEIWWPYHITGDDDRYSFPKPRVWNAQPGDYTLSATAFLPAQAQGLKSSPLRITFRIEP